MLCIFIAIKKIPTKCMCVDRFHKYILLPRAGEVSFVENTCIMYICIARTCTIITIAKVPEVKQICNYI